MARLLEGHPNIASYPIERRFSNSKYEWPALSEVLCNRDFKGLCRAIDVYNNIEYQSKLGVLAKGVYQKVPFVFDFGYFLARFRELLDHNSPAHWNERVVFDSQARAFFEAWEQGRYFDEHRIKYVANHLSRSFAIPVRRFFDVYPDGYIFCVIRDPRGYYNSVKPTLSIDQFDHDFLESMIGRWEEATNLAIQNQIGFPDRYFVIRFEDLVAETSMVMHSLCDFIGVEFDTCVTTPTLAGQPWFGNSSFGQSDGGVRSDRARTWEGRLSADEVWRIEDRLGALMRLFSYDVSSRTPTTRGFLLDVFARQQKVLQPSSKTQDTHCQMEIERLRTENERLATIFRKSRRRRKVWHSLIHRVVLRVKKMITM